MADNKVLSNIDYNINNRSNYGVSKEETREIVDIPYFPAQNLVDVSGQLNVFSPDNINKYIPYTDSLGNRKILGLVNRTDARMLFIDYDVNSREIIYRFAGVNYPQGRTGFSHTYDGSYRLLIFGGLANGRALQDLWEYNIRTKEWKLLNFSKLETSANQMPSRRRNSSMVEFGDEIILFGGETDTLIGDTFVSLNDLWTFDKNSEEWTNYDPDRILPRRVGNIIYSSATEIKILIVDGTDELGNPQNKAVWTVNKNDGTVTSSDYTPPFSITKDNVSLFLNGEFYIHSGGDLYKWDNGTSDFTLIYSDVAGIYDDLWYWTVVNESVDRGGDSRMDSFTITKPELYNDSDVLQKTASITTPPKFDIPHAVTTDDGVFWYAGMITGNTFNERTFKFSKNTNQTQVYDFSSDSRPTERINASVTYDKYNNRVWFFGGYDGSKYYNDLWYFDLDSNIWVKVKDNVQNQNEEIPTVPQPRNLAGICVVENGNFVYIIGGYSDVQSFNDFWKYQIDIDSWNREIPIETIPFGSSYQLFEYNDRLWMFNGDLSGLYRYYFSKKQFVKQPLKRDFASEKIKNLIQQREFLRPQIHLNISGETVYIYNGEIGNISIDMTNRTILDYNREFSLDTRINWIDEIKGFDSESLNTYFINISPLESLTKNQIPHSFFHYDFQQGNKVGFFGSENGINLSGVSGDSSIFYFDKGGSFELQSRNFFLNKAELLADGDIAFTGLQSEHSEDLNDPNQLTTLTLDALSQPQTAPLTPQFIYSKNSIIQEQLQGAVNVFTRSRDGNRIYIMYKNGNIVRLNLDDFTFFTYFTKMWKSSSIGYYDSNDSVVGFGGIFGDRTPYDKNGLKINPISINNNTLKTHSGLLKLDLSLNQFSINSLNSNLSEQNRTFIDLDVTKDYLIDTIKDFLESDDSQLPLNVETLVKEKLYLSTQPIIDDLTQHEIIFENGNRPYRRALHMSCTIGKNMYVFGGADLYTTDTGTCINPTNFPYFVSKLATIENQWRTSNGQPTLDSEDISKSAYKYDMDTNTWTRLENLPFWLYGSTCIPSPDNTKIYFVGGSKKSNISELYNGIIVYDIENDSYEEFNGIPNNYRGRMNPVLHWIDNNRLMIMYGTQPKLEICGDCNCWTHYPVNDVWILDIRNEVFYKSFEDLQFLGLAVKDDFIKNKEEEKFTYSLAPFPVIQDVNDESNFINTKIHLNKINLVDGNIDTIPINPGSEIYDDFLSNFDNQENSNTQSDVFSEVYLEGVKNNTNFRFRYSWIEEFGDDFHKHLFVIGERADQSGIEFISKMAQGFEEAHLRIWYVDIELAESQREFTQIPVDYVLPTAPGIIVYDGSKYLFVIWNKFNIWRLDLKGVIDNPNENNWFRLPPCANCDFLDNLDDDAEPWSGFYLPPRNIVLVSSKGRVAKLDTETFTWFLDKETPPVKPFQQKQSIVSRTDVDSEEGEVYRFFLGGIGGQFLNIYYKQWDNFFFDLRSLSNVIDLLGTVVENNFYPTYIKRKRLYLNNELGHLFSSWIRIDGSFDVEYQMEDFYDGQLVRIYTDSEGISQSNNWEVEVFALKQGWQTINTSNYTVVQNEVDWEWDGNFFRRYVRDVVLAGGETSTQTTTLPDNYIDVDIESTVFSEPISRIRLKFMPDRKENNYITRLNKLDLIDQDNEINIYDNPGDVTPLTIINLEPVVSGDNFTNEFAITIKNESSKTVKFVDVYMVNNLWVQFSLDGISWKTANELDPLRVSEELNAGSEREIIVRGINIDDTPRIGDIVVKGLYSYT